MTTQLTKLKIDEVSGVDAGAHQLDGWMVIKKAASTAFKDDQELLDFVLAGLAANLAKANPQQHRGADGKFRQHIQGLTNRAAATPPSPSAASAPQPVTVTSPAAEPVTRSLFRPARGYRRIW